MTDQEIIDLAEKEWGNVHRAGVLAFINGYKAAIKECYSSEDVLNFLNWSHKCKEWAYCGDGYAYERDGDRKITHKEFFDLYINSLKRKEMKKSFFIVKLSQIGNIGAHEIKKIKDQPEEGFITEGQAETHLREYLNNNDNPSWYNFSIMPFYFKMI